MNAVLQLKPRSAFEQACRDIIELKQIEDDAKARRYTIEKALAAMVGEATEGTLHAEEGRFKVTATYKLTRTVDGAKVQAAWNDLPAIVQEAFVWKPDLALKHYRALESANPEAFAVLAKYVTAKPAKPAIKIEEVE